MTDIPDDEDVNRYHGGFIWSAIRSGLAHHRERLVAAFDMGNYERESAALDEVARRITADIEPLVETYSLRAAREGK